MKKFVTISALSLIISLIWAADPAHADSIDGDWCDTQGHRLAIEGPQIVTPGGTKMEGDYDRHAFYYKVPAGEAQSGRDIAIQWSMTIP